MSNPREFSLFIADLDATNTEEQISKFFSDKLSQDALINVKVCYDHSTPGRSLRYGYLNFKNAEVMDKALESLNYQKIGNAKKSYRLSRYQPDPTVRKSGVGNVIVKNLPVEWAGEHAKLHDIASPAGSINSCVVCEHHGKESAHGYVQFANEEEAKKAIEQLNGLEVEGKKIVVEKAANVADRKHNEIFISGFPKEIDGELKTILSAYGQVTQVDIRDELPKFGHYAYVWFEDEAAAANCVEKLKDKPIRPEVDAEQKTNVSIYYVRAERIAYKKKLSEASKNKNMYVRGFPSWYDDEDLKKLFEPYGAITSCKVMKNAEGIPKGFGFCQFAETAPAANAFVELNGKKIPSQKPEDIKEGETPLEVELYVNYAQTKEEREFNQPKRGHPTNHSMYGRKPNAKQQQPQQFSPPPYPFPYPPYAYQPNSPMPFFRGYPNIASPTNVPLAPNAYAYPMFPQQQRQNPNQRRGQMINPMFYMQQRQLQFMQQPNMRMPMYPSPGTMPNNGSPISYGINPATGSPSSTAQSGSPAGAPMGDQMGSPVQVAQTSSPKSTGQPGTPTSSSMPTTPESGATASMGGSPYNQPQNVGPITIDRQTLNGMSEEDQKQTIGEHLFQRINLIDPASAGKITGMLLELDINELLHLLQNPNELSNKVKEAQAVLQDASANQ